ncbi:MAG: hemin uptake protein HemP [Alphaproteobacteria bacterium]|jgi:hemin uptake protein HemP|nr:hemin uptake protein HemP [Alphaproteobacteria bacterium]MBU0805492.1 hemin uptake protein HemP [Alphaproteobacteria bacterium]MBU0873438.1 hemin uptake protein HemP [Alphaproteobacteria bacterium]MBU1401334.1 hemin uptake protein HemP [Alphaproteobacteria bacterium]MBU1592249.1 hemin uptake protein HemP [Alphaproteobacteria bacterium]
MNAHNPYEFRLRPRREGSDQHPRQQQTGTPPKTVSSDALFEGLYEIGIHHAGALYRLKITRQGKLILNK